MSIYSDSEYEVSSVYKGSDSDSDLALSRTASPGGEELCSEDYETFEPDKTMSSPMAVGSNEDEDGAQALEIADQIANPSAVAIADDKGQL